MHTSHTSPYMHTHTQQCLLPKPQTQHTLSPLFSETKTLFLSSEQKMKKHGQVNGSFQTSFPSPRSCFFFFFFFFLLAFIFLLDPKITLLRPPPSLNTQTFEPFIKKKDDPAWSFITSIINKRMAKDTNGTGTPVCAFTRHSHGNMGKKRFPEQTED